MNSRVLALSLVLLAGGCYAETQHYYIFGDSLSSPTGCEWPRQLHGAVHNYAQAGLTLAAFDLPHHFKVEPNGIAVVYIGTNDAGAGYRINPFRRQLQELVSTLRSRGMARIYLVGQPYLSVLEGKADPFRVVTQEVAEEFGTEYLDPLWGDESTVDGVHPSCINHAYLGYWFRFKLGE